MEIDVESCSSYTC